MTEATAAEEYQKFIDSGAPDPLNAIAMPYQDLLIAIAKATDEHGLRIKLDPRALIPFIPAAVAAMKPIDTIEGRPMTEKRATWKRKIEIEYNQAYGLRPWEWRCYRNGEAEPYLVGSKDNEQRALDEAVTTIEIELVP